MKTSPDCVSVLTPLTGENEIMHSLILHILLHIFYTLP
jgi:hypothetical protein